MTMKMGLMLIAAAATLGTAAIATPASAQYYHHDGYRHGYHHDWHRDHWRHDRGWRWHHRYAYRHHRHYR
jgi:hypothetical protein